MEQHIINVPHFQKLILLSSLQVKIPSASCIHLDLKGP